MATFSIDYETSSAADIGDVGAWRYACDPTTRILMFAIAKDEQPPVIWRFDQADSEESQVAKLLAVEAMARPNSVIHAFNVQFEVAISRYRLEQDVGVVPGPLESWRCVQAVCRRCGLPNNLKDAAIFLKLPQQKDGIGRPLIQLFCNRGKVKTLDRGKERMTTTSPIHEEEIPWDWSVTILKQTYTIREAWDLFISYCRQDVVVEREVRRELAKYAFTGAELDGFLFDLRMNARGVPVDVPTLLKAGDLIEEFAVRLGTRFREVTGLNPTQGVAILAWMTQRGYPGDNLQAETVEKILEDPDCPMESVAKEALKNRTMLSFAAVQKVSAMLRWVCPDGRIRGAFIYYGAQKTGRWTSQGPQFQNMKKPPKWMKPYMGEIYDWLVSVSNDEIEFFYGNPYEVLASCARYFVRFPDRKIYDIDFAQVEARILPALICCDRILDKFRAGEDIYKSVAKALYTTRDMGKIISLLCQFAGGWNAVKIPLGDAITEKEARRAVAVYRKENPEVVKSWKTMQNSFLEALQNPGRWVKATPHIQFGYTKKAPFPRMCMRLPAGRDLIYPHPKSEPITMWRREVKNKETKEVSEKWEKMAGHHDLESPHFHTHELFFWGHVKGKTYGWVKTYGGDLLQSATQGTGMDFLLHGCVEAERRGFEPFFVVHDQALAPDEGGLENFIEALCTRPVWFPDFPLEADGHIAPSYTKD